MTTVAVVGALATRPGNGGGAWVRLAYALGLRRLGCDARLVEEAPGAAPDAVEYARAVAAEANLPYELADDGLEGADLLVNVSGNLRVPHLLRRFRRTLFLDLDPGFTQVWHERGLDPIPPHDVYFTVGENVGRPGCEIPTCGLEWRATRPPVLLDEWPPVKGSRDRFTTVATWRAPFGAIEPYGLKHHEWRRLLPLPQLVPARFEAALAIHPGDARDRDALERHGWRLADPAVVATPDTFRAYVQESGAEFSVAQGIYVEARSGWFSDRSVRYLASGKPALVQDTATPLPTGEGIVTFRTLDDAVRGAHEILGDYDRHARAARRLAEEYFNSDLVLTRMLEDALA